MHSEYYVTDLIILLGHIDEEVRGTAKSKLIAIGRPAIPQLIDVFTQDCWYIFTYPAKFSPYMEEAARPIYMEQIANEAAEILAQLGEAAVPALTTEFTRAEREFSEWFHKTLYYKKYADGLDRLLADIIKGKVDV